MPVCGKRVTHKTPTGKDITPLVSYTCEVQLPNGSPEHEGPCASPSDVQSALVRQRWMDQNKQDEALRRHQEAGLSMTQSIPMSSASIIEDPTTTDPQRHVARHHPSEEVDCPFCDEKPLWKNLEEHIRSHAGTPAQDVSKDFRHEAVYPDYDQVGRTLIQQEVRDTLPRPPVPTVPSVETAPSEEWVVGSRAAPTVAEHPEAPSGDLLRMSRSILDAFMANHGSDDDPFGLAQQAWDVVKRVLPSS